MRYGHQRRWLVEALATLAGLAVAGTTMAGGLAGSAAAAPIGTASSTAGCGKAATVTSGNQTIQSGGTTRNFIVRLPDNYDPNHPYRLIFGFHWNGGTANDVDGGGTSGYSWSYYGLRALSNNSTIFVAPQGLGNGWANSGDRDLTFVDDMVRFVESGLCVDTSLLFSTGFSYGGGMSYAIACARASVFRAAAATVALSRSRTSGCTACVIRC
jgi:poly(3-hydroxybutyrate) depolymerase